MKAQRAGLFLLVRLPLHALPASQEEDALVCAIRAFLAQKFDTLRRTFTLSRVDYILIIV